MSNEHIRQFNHFVPRLHLKRFSARPGLLLHYPLLVPTSKDPLWREIAISKAAAHHHLYTVSRADETNSAEIEEWFGEAFESPAEEAIERAVTGARLTPDHWRRLVRFLAAQELRTPRAYHAFIESFGPQLQSIMNEEMEELRQKLMTGVQLPSREAEQYGAIHDLLPTKTEIVETDDPTIRAVRVHASLSRRTWLWSLKQALRDDGPINILCGLRWTILVPPEGESMFTSDVPVLKVSPGIPAGTYIEGRWGVPGTVLMMPLSPRHLLCAQVGARRAQPYSTMNRESFRRLKTLAADLAFRSIYGATPDPLVQSLRPRTVDRTRFLREKELWASWHSEHSKAERFED